MATASATLRACWLPVRRLPNFKATDGAGGISGSYDASRYFPTNQNLWFKGYFDYDRTNVSSPGVGSAQLDNYSFQGSVLYSNALTYIGAAASYNIGSGSETQTVVPSTGSFDSHGYAADVRLGHVFVLLNSINSRSPFPTRVPPKSTGGYGLGLDVSGHVGYVNQQFDSFTDSNGFIFGPTQTHFGDVGARAKLFWYVPSNGWIWMPYVAGTLDQHFNFSSALNIPAQAALPGGDVFTLMQSPTYWGGEWGLDVTGAKGLTVGAKGYYTASSDTNILGGSVYVKIPFSALPLVAARY